MVFRSHHRGTPPLAVILERRPRLTGTADRGCELVWDRPRSAIYDFRLASTRHLSAMYPYRVFVSYAHVDRHLVERLVAILRDAGVKPLWDDDLLPGTGFS